MTVARYPLTWPATWPRTAPGRRQFARFNTKRVDKPYQTKRALTVAEAVSRLLAELQRFGVREGDIVVTNVPTRLDGLPYSNAAEPSDPGVAVYFRLRGADRVLACDRYTKVAGNLAAVAAHIEALRAIARYGVGTVEQAFAGYTALPPPPEVDWPVVLGVPRSASPDQIQERFRALAFTAHPDRGGSTDAMARLNAARDAALRERSA